MSNFTKSVSLGAHNIAFSLLRKLVGTIPQVWEQSRPLLRWRVNLLWEQTQEGGNFLRACELADTTVPLYYDNPLIPYRTSALVRLVTIISFAFDRGELP